MVGAFQHPARPGGRGALVLQMLQEALVKPIGRHMAGASSQRRYDGI